MNETTNPIESNKEILYWHGRRSWRSILKFLLLGILMTLTIWFSIPGILLIIYVIIVVRDSKYFITNKYIYIRGRDFMMGHKQQINVMHEWVTDITITQGPIAKILNYGDIIIYFQYEQNTYYAKMEGIINPTSIKTMIENIIIKNKENKEKERIYKKLVELERERELGKISEAEYQELKKYYEEKLKKYS